MKHLVALLVAIWASQVHACAPREVMLEQLEGWNEELAGRGLFHTETFVFELWVGPTGSWTVLRTSLANVSCVMASGDSWSRFEPEPEGTDG